MSISKQDQPKILVTKIFSIRPWIPVFVVGLIFVIVSIFLEGQENNWSGNLGLCGALLLVIFFFEEVVRNSLAPEYEAGIQGNVLLLKPKNIKKQMFQIASHDIKKIFITRDRWLPVKGPPAGERYRINIMTELQRYMFDWRIREHDMKHWDIEHAKYTLKSFNETYPQTPGQFLIEFFVFVGVPQEKILYYHNKFSDWGF